MTKLDWVLSFIALAGFIVFVGIISAFVMEPDLAIVIAISVALAVYDFWIRPLRTRRAAR
ncbi:hypothetical protein [Acuticoccus mangrovi]|uniref:Uncharacterized protein n=1 Tax=Acuticoccus mangrovi TaxID=2796142 RepID=A0A934IRB9_9HYPH|nr:hypothetical protein [Acuticoccus mangrovi]MBJ3776229.1 hypothetical protein [Acuticoccus mangrovi]